MSLSIIDENFWLVLEEIRNVRNSICHEIPNLFIGFSKNDIIKVAENCFPALDWIERLTYKKRNLMKNKK